jgi:hypothetical protein
MTPRGSVDWERVRSVLKEIHSTSPDFLSENALIGGGASWFFRHQIELSNDKDFALSLTDEEKGLWFSKDIDFMGSMMDDYERLLHISRTGEPPRFRIQNVWIDTPEIGLRMHPDTVLKRAYLGSLDGFNFQVAHPVDVLNEKQALLKSPKADQRPQDRLHIEALRTFIKLDLCQRIENPAYFQNLADAKAWREDATFAKEVDESIFECPLFRKRMENIQTHLESISFANPVRQWIRHHIFNAA